MSQKIALISGVTGQDGAYLTRLLLEKGYSVHGIRRRSSTNNCVRIQQLLEQKQATSSFYLHDGDVTDMGSIISILQKTNPDEIYHLAAQSFVQSSFHCPEYTANVDGLGTLRFLEAMRLSKSTAKFYQASTSELYGLVQQVPQTEQTPFYPRSPYGVAKLYAYWIAVNYREAYNMFVSNGILFNHESPLRGEEFVTRKITKTVAEIALGIKQILRLGNLNAQRDWGHAKDYVEAMWRIVQYDMPSDWVIATGKTHSVRSFVTLAFMQIGIKIHFIGEGVDERGFVDSIDEAHFYKMTGRSAQHICRKTPLIEVDSSLFRPSEVQQLVGDASKAHRLLDWRPSVTLDELANEMVVSEIEALT